jgi:hypothetical protein
MTKLRMEKMQDIRHQLKGVGHVMSLDVAPQIENLSGMRRLKAIHEKSVKSRKETEALNKGNEDMSPAPVQVIATTPAVAHMVAEEPMAEGDKKSFPVWAIVVISIVGGLFLILIGIIGWKYQNWKPKAIARKGYRATKKSQGLSLVSPRSDSESHYSVESPTAGITRQPLSN